MVQPGIRVIVVGGGVGGLTTAIALRRAGIDVTVFERAADLRKIQVGSGIHLWHNAIRALQELEVADRVQAVGEVVERMEWRNSRGKDIAAWDVGGMGAQLNAPAIGIVRSDLYETLADCVEDGVVQLGSEFTRFEQDDRGVTAHFADGRTESADVLIGADGLRSLVRAQLHGHSEPKYAGYMLWHAAVDAPDGLVPPHIFRESWGPGARFGFYPVRGRTYWFCLVKAPAGGVDPEGGRKAAVLARYRGWLEPTEALIEATPEEAIARADIVGRDPIRQWGDGRVTLLGDAVHPMTPNLGQGAAQAIEDAVILGKCLGSETDPVTALRAYEARRKDRTASIMKRAWKIGETGRWENPAACVARDWIMKVVFPTLAWRQQGKDMAYEF